MIEALKVFQAVEFDSYHHIYTVDGIEYTSVTQYLSRYKPPFDSKAISEKKAKTLGILARMLQDDWSIKGLFSSACGSDFHLYVETFLRYNKRRDIYTPIYDRIAEFHRFWDEYRYSYKIIEQELIIFDKQWQLAGTIDCLLQDIATGTYVIMDWKTSAEITKQNRYANMNKPFGNFPNSNYYHYALQLALYKSILQRNTDLKVDSCMLVHFPHRKPFEIIHMDETIQQVEKLMEVD